MATRTDEEFADYIAARLPSLRRLGYLLCQDWHRAEDLAQAAAVKAYTHWPKASHADNIDAYVNAILVREFLHERRSAWIRRVSLTEPPETAAGQDDHDRSLDLQAAVAALPARQRAILVLRFYCDLNIYQTADTLGCPAGTVKSQTARALDALRRTMAVSEAAGVSEGSAPAGSPVLPAAGRTATDGGQLHA
jgi:RNA polymerase sigma-70 factor (sigma-E family)